MKKTDYLIIGIIGLSLIVVLLIWKVAFSNPGYTYEILCDNSVIKTGNLLDDCYVVIDGGRAVEFKDKHEADDYCDKHDTVTNYVVVSKGFVNVIAANCPDKICVNTEPVNEIGRSIVCMPNKVAISVRK